MCKAKDCRYYKTCLVKRELVGEHHCDDYKKEVNPKKCVRANNKE